MSGPATAGHRHRPLVAIHPRAGGDPGQRPVAALVGTRPVDPQHPRPPRTDRLAHMPEHRRIPSAADGNPDDPTNRHALLGAGTRGRLGLACAARPRARTRQRLAIYVHPAAETADPVGFPCRVHVARTPRLRRNGHGSRRFCGRGAQPVRRLRCCLRRCRAWRRAVPAEGTVQGRVALSSSRWPQAVRSRVWMVTSVRPL